LANNIGSGGSQSGPVLLSTGNVAQPYSGTSTPGNITVVFNATTVINPAPEAVQGATPPVWPTSTATQERVEYYAPPGYTGNVTLALDIFKSRNGANIVLANSVPITVTVPQDNQGPAGNNFLPVSTIGITKTMPIGNPYSFASDMAMVDPAGGRIDWQNLAPARYNFNIVQSEVKGWFRFRNIQTGSTTSLTDVLNITNQTQLYINNILTGGAGEILEFVPRLPVGAFFPPVASNTSGPLTLNLTVQRIYGGVTTTIATRQLNYIIQ
jgi:hypothetical protein